jgi:hypothetical protein
VLQPRELGKISLEGKAHAARSPVASSGMERTSLPPAPPACSPCPATFDSRPPLPPDGPVPRRLPVPSEQARHKRAADQSIGILAGSISRYLGPDAPGRSTARGKLVDV